jgi:hypothetical protein
VRLVVAAGLAALAVAAIVVLGTSEGVGSPGPDAAVEAHGRDAAAVTVAVGRGTTLRIADPAGAIQVWRPAGYRAETAATVVYVHGYDIDVDHAWTAHHLPEQFAASAINAVFIAPEAPRGARDPIAFRDLGELIRIVEVALGEPRPSGPLIVIGHSGGYRTLSAWIDYPLLDSVILIDALYGELDEIRDWLAAGAARRLVTTGYDTVRWTEDLARSIPDTVVVDRVPPTMELWPPEARTARHLYVRSQYTHMGQITGGVVIPMLLRLEAVELLADAPWDLALEGDR